MINKQTANFIVDQMIGEYSGHMSMIPNNPLLHSFFSSFTGWGQNTRDDMPRILRELADGLEGKNDD